MEDKTKKTKEELIIKVAQLEQKINYSASEDLELRQEFAKAFNWGESKQDYGYSSKKWEVANPSWEQIFIEVGKLLAKKDFRNLENDVQAINQNIHQLFRVKKDKTKEEMSPENDDFMRRNLGL